MSPDTSLSWVEAARADVSVRSQQRGALTLWILRSNACATYAVGWHGTSEGRSGSPYRTLMCLSTIITQCIESHSEAVHPTLYCTRLTRWVILTQHAQRRKTRSAAFGRNNRRKTRTSPWYVVGPRASRRARSSRVARPSGGSAGSRVHACLLSRVQGRCTCLMCDVGAWTVVAGQLRRMLS